MARSPRLEPIRRAPGRRGPQARGSRRDPRSAGNCRQSTTEPTSLSHCGRGCSRPTVGPQGRTRNDLPWPTGVTATPTSPCQVAESSCYWYGLCQRFTSTYGCRSGASLTTTSTYRLPTTTGLSSLTCSPWAFPSQWRTVSSTWPFTRAGWTQDGGTGRRTGGGPSTPSLRSHTATGRDFGFVLAGALSPRSRDSEGWTGPFVCCATRRRNHRQQKRPLPSVSISLTSVSSVLSVGVPPPGGS